MTPDGEVWARQKSDSYAFWSRYVAGFDSVTVLGRARPVDAAPAGWLRSDGPGVTCSPIPDFVGPYQLPCSAVTAPVYPFRGIRALFS